MRFLNKENIIREETRSLVFKAEEDSRPRSRWFDQSKNKQCYVVCAS